MPALSVTKSYVNAAVLTETDLDNIKTSIESWANTTKLDSSNIQTGGIATANLADSSVTQVKLAAASYSDAAVENYSITCTVAASALTIALKTRAGADASSTDTIRAAFRSATLATGTYTERNITGALSLTISSGSTLGHASAASNYIYVYLFDNAGTILLAASSTRFDEGVLQTTTAEGGAGGADSATVLYASSGVASKAIRLIGRLTSNQTTAGTYAAVPTEISLLPFSMSRSEVRVTVDNGEGSTNTKIRRWTNTVTNIGSDITYADSAANGGSFTINRDGLYSMVYSDDLASANDFGITLNSASLTTAITSLAVAEILGIASTRAANTRHQCAFTGYFRAGDVIRGHIDTEVSGTSDNAEFFHITRIG